MSHRFRRQCRPALGTFVEIALHEEDLPEQADQQAAIFDAAFAQIAEVQQQMSFHDADSALSRINLAAPGTTLTLPDWTYELLTIARQLYTATDGLFDCGVGARLVSDGLLPRHPHAVTHQHASAQDPASKAGRSTITDLQFHGDNQITLARRVCLDLGGIAKGFAVDKAVAAINAMQVARCLVNAGGDLKVAGEFAQDIVVRHPLAPTTLIPFGQLSQGAVATSAPYFSLRGDGNGARCALYDPNGTSLTRSHSYTVLAPDCVIADALTKAVAAAFNRHAYADRNTPAQTTTPIPFHPAFLSSYQAQAFVM
jgi:thiamine biosynthesis lipoprotein